VAIISGLMSQRVAQCGECGARSQLQVWWGDDGYGWPYGHTLRCSNCPLRDLWKDRVSPYNPLHHDKIFGLSDWDVPFQYVLNTHQQALCFACDTAFDPEQAHGGEYLPEEMWDATRCNTEVLCCRECYIERRRRHTDIQIELAAATQVDLAPLNRSIEAYFERAPRGLLPKSQ
jgi:hypothetical protein